MFEGMKDLWDVGEKPMLVMLWSCGHGWAAPGVTQIQKPILEVIPEVRGFAASCCLPLLAPIKARGSQSVEDAH